MDTSISLIVPAHNEGARLRAFFKALYDLPAPAPICDLVIVLDHCTDDSADICRDAAVPPGIGLHVIERSEGRGDKAAAVAAGLNAVVGEYVCLWDADLEYDLSALPEMCAAAGVGILVSGRRRAGMGWKSRLANTLVRTTLNKWGWPPSDVLTGVHLAETRWLCSMFARARPAGYALETAIVRTALADDLHMTNVDVPYTPRTIDEGRGIRWFHLFGLLVMAGRKLAPARQDGSGAKGSENQKTAVASHIAPVLLAGMAALGMGFGFVSPPAHAYFFNPMTDTNWNDMLPISIGGVSMGGGQPPIVYEPPVCVCPSHFYGGPMPGIGVTFWEPMYVAEVVRHPGKLITLSGTNVLGGAFKSEMGPAAGRSSGENHASRGANRAQVHWYTYPLFGIIGAEINTICGTAETPFSLAGMTEIDPIWQDDLWSNVLSPESVLFATLPMQLACLADAVSATVAYPLSPLFWCAGAWGSVYPFSGNPNSQSSDQQSNALVLSKYIAMESRVGFMWATVGPEAVCSAAPSPIWIKGQWRFDPIYPLPTFGAPIYIGQSEVRWGMSPPANYPDHQDSAYLIWQGEQCCVRF